MLVGKPFSTLLLWMFTASGAAFLCPESIMYPLAGRIGGFVTSSSSDCIQFPRHQIAVQVLFDPGYGGCAVVVAIDNVKHPLFKLIHSYSS